MARYFWVFAKTLGNELVILQNWLENVDITAIFRKYIARPLPLISSQIENRRFYTELHNVSFTKVMVMEGDRILGSRSWDLGGTFHSQNFHLLEGYIHLGPAPLPLEREYEAYFFVFVVTSSILRLDYVPLKSQCSQLHAILLPSIPSAQP